MKTRFLILLFCCGVVCNSYAQQTDTPDLKFAVHLSTTPTDSFSKTHTRRQWAVGGISALGYGTSLIILDKAWYQQYEKTSFHTFNDAGEWLQVDKVGHAWTAYNTSRASTALWKWSGLPPEKAVWIGSLTGFSYLTVIEFLDAHSATWGWSWADMGANFFGSALFAAQELHWKEQKIQFKFSAHQNRYPAQLKPRANSLYGTTLPERLLKDYNAQTYWLSVPLPSLLPQTNLPEWLNISIGYGATGLWGGFENVAYDKQGNVTFDRTDIRRHRQWYLAPDIDLTKIKTKNKTLRTTLAILNTLKFPAPALEYSNGKFKGHWLFF